MRASSVIVLIGLVTGFVSCKQESRNVVSKTQTSTTPEVLYDTLPANTEGADMYRLSSGKVFWSGAKAIGAKHNGTFQVSEGTFYVKDGRLIRSDVVIDINSMTVEDLTDAGERKDFLAHMKSADFFNAAQYPTAKFKMTENIPNVNLPDYPAVILGEATIKGKTKEISIPAKITVNGNQLKINTPGFALNRTDFGINFGSSVLGTAADKLIHDHISIYLEVSAEKK